MLELVRRLRCLYRRYVADTADLLLQWNDGAMFCRTWQEVSPILSWDHRPAARRLWELAATGGEGTIVEIGSYLGNSTVYLARSGGEVHAIDPHSPQSMTQLHPAGEVSECFLENLERFSVSDHVRYHRLTSLEAAREWNGQKIRLLFIDGLHTREAVLSDYHAWQRHLAHQHAVLFDDFLWPEVDQAVRELRAEVRPRYFYVRDGQAIFSTRRLGLRQAGLP